MLSSRRKEFDKKDEIETKIEVLGELCHETVKSQLELKRMQDKIKALELAQQEWELIKEVEALEHGLR